MAEERQHLLIDKLIRFVQTSIYHDTHKQPPTMDHCQTLAFGYGRCGHAAVLLHVLFKIFRIKSRIIGIGPGHWICEFYYDRAWRIADADYFKDEILKTSTGEYLTLGEIRQTPDVLDRFTPAPTLLDQSSWMGGTTQELLDRYKKIMQGKVRRIYYNPKTGLTHTLRSFILSKIGLRRIGNAENNHATYQGQTSSD